SKVGVDLAKPHSALQRPSLFGLAPFIHPPTSNSSQTTTMSFNFDAYFRQHAPSEIWSIQPLTGGIVNFTVRAVRSRIDPLATSPHDTDPAPRGPSGRFSEHESLVLKYAPPYVALVGEQAPFDRVRQVCTLL
ncbi:hypothetical protein FQN55_001757, partial [Onygenales sp. PD_40]